MAFASIFVPNFRVQAVVRSEPALRDRPLALVEGTSSILTVSGLNTAAAKMGVSLGMTKSQAQQFGPIEVRPRSRRQEDIAHAALLDLGWSVSPRIEDTAADTMLLDLAGLACLFGDEKGIAGQLAEGAKRLGFITQIATASNLDAAILASWAFAGITLIPRGEETAIIGKVRAITLSPSLEIQETLERWGVRTCAELAALPVLQLSERLGQEGVRLHALAQARSTRSMVLAQPAVCFEEEMELEYAEAEIEPLAFLLGRLLDQLCARLGARSLAAGAIQVLFQLEPAFEKEPRMLRDNSPPESTPNMYERTLRLPVPISDSKMLLKLLVLRLQSDAPSTPVWRITLVAEAARRRVSQGGLFAPISPNPEKVELTLARVAKLVGDANIGSPALLDTHRPEGFRMGQFAASQNSGDSPRQVSRSPGSENRASAEAMLKSIAPGCKAGFRVFRPTLSVWVEVRQGYPARVTFPGIRGRVVAASGPWRRSGDWWKEDAWQGDEWDLEIHFDTFSHLRLPAQITNRDAKGSPSQGIYRMFYDGARQEWFVRGAYD